MPSSASVAGVRAFINRSASSNATGMVTSTPVELRAKSPVRANIAAKSRRLVSCSVKGFLRWFRAVLRWHYYAPYSSPLFSVGYPAVYVRIRHF